MTERFENWAPNQGINRTGTALRTVLPVMPSTVMRRKNRIVGLPLPMGLTRLIEAGVWPSSDGPPVTAQEFDPLMPADRVQRFAEEESLICLHPPPFTTIAEHQAAGGADDFWKRFGALDQIVPEKALIIGDFGLGSDSPIILDFARNASNPPVLRLRWGPDRRNDWVQGARDFDEFAEMLGLTAGGVA